MARYENDRHIPATLRIARTRQAVRVNVSSHRATGEPCGFFFDQE
jgi:hypothetical protein